MRMHIAPQIERPNHIVVQDFAKLPATIIPAHSSRVMNSKPIAGKHQAPSMICYESKSGRGKKQAEESMWYAIPHDLDKTNLTIDQLEAILSKLPYEIMWWTTWSCKPHNASARVLFRLTADVNYDRAIKLWWHCRQILIDAGLPTHNIEGKSCTDGCAMDGRLFFLPSKPADETDPTWGGVAPRGCDIGASTSPRLDPLAVPALDLLEEVDAWRKLWPTDTCPGGAGRAGSGRAYTAANGSSSTSTKVYIDFGTVSSKVNGLSVYAWVNLNLKPNQQINAASILNTAYTWNTGQDITSYSTCTYHLEDDGSMWAHCHVNNTTYIHAPALADFQPEEDSKSKVTTYSLADLAAGKFLPHHNLTHDITILKSPWGTGKTELMRYLVAQARKAGQRVLSIVHRQTLAGQQAKRLGVSSYLNNVYGGDVTICIDSLHKLEIDMLDPGEYILLLDEAEQLFAHTVCSSTMEPARATENFNLLKGLIARASKVVAADADFGQVGYDFLASTNKNIEIRNIPEPLFQAKPELIKVQNKHDWRARITRDLIEGKKLAIFMESKQGAKDLAGFIETKIGAKVLLVSADTTDVQEYREKLENINEIITEYQVLIYTHSMGTGYSIDVKDHFDRRYAWLSNETGTAEETMQGLARIRHPKSPEVFFYGKRHRGTTLPTDPKVIFEQMVLCRMATYNLVCKVLFIFCMDGSMSYDAEQADLACKYISKIRMTGGLGGSKLNALHQYCQAHNIKITTVDPILDEKDEAAFRSEYEEVEQAVLSGEITAVQEADEISHEEAKSIVCPRDMQQKMEKKRAYILHTYGDLQDDTIEAALTDRNYFAKVRLLAATKLIYTNQAGVVGFFDQQRWSNNLARTPTLLLQAKLLSSFFREFGVAPGEDLAYDEAKMIDWMQKNSRLKSLSSKSYFNFSKPIKAWRALLDTVSYTSGMCHTEANRNSNHQVKMMVEAQQSKQQVDLQQHSLRVEEVMQEIASA